MTAKSSYGSMAPPRIGSTRECSPPCICMPTSAADDTYRFPPGDIFYVLCKYLVSYVYVISHADIANKGISTLPGLTARIAFSGWVTLGTAANGSVASSGSLRSAPHASCIRLA